MTLDVRINGQRVNELLTAPPSTKDSIDGVCRTLDLQLQAVPGIINYLGSPVELWYNGSLWFFGFVFRRGIDSSGASTYMAYDPLIWFKKRPDDYYYKNMTATQIIRALAEELGVKVGSLANTGAVFPRLYYQGADPDKIAVDVLARTAQQTGRNYWFRYDPVNGLELFERKVPAEIWAFQVGVNLVRAEYEESIEETATVVRLVNRETGKTVIRSNPDAIRKYGNMQHFEEVDKDAAATMEKRAQELLKQLSKVQVTSNIDGINPDRVMPQMYSGDVVYVEEAVTQLVGAYHIIEVTQTFESDDLVSLAMNIQAAPDIPTLQYENATQDPNQSTSAGGSEATAGVPEYSADLLKIMEQYGLNGASDKPENKGASTNPAYNQSLDKVAKIYETKGLK